HPGTEEAPSYFYSLADLETTLQFALSDVMVRQVAVKNSIPIAGINSNLLWSTIFPTRYGEPDAVTRESRAGDIADALVHYADARDPSQDTPSGFKIVPSFTPSGFPTDDDQVWGSWSIYQVDSDGRRVGAPISRANQYTKSSVRD